MLDTVLIVLLMYFLILTPFKLSIFLFILSLKSLSSCVPTVTQLIVEPVLELMFPTPR